ncbi:MAG: hypothetical protein NTZ59_02420 [Bacteroidetes bacterium]|nr:hypothetical protein [Bacteroidota bacterium]
MDITTQVNSVEMLSKMLVVFGTISTFLLALIVYFLKRLVNEHDKTIDKVNRHEIKFENHEQRITVLEKTDLTL